MSIVGVENFESFLPHFFDVHKEFTKKLADSIDKC